MATSAPKPDPAAIDRYIAAFPPEVRTRLERMRTTIRRAAPGAMERVAYGMPTFYLNGNLVHFAGFPSHVGFYPTPTGISAFGKQLASYKSAKGSVQFPHDEPLPLDLVAEIVRFRVAEMMQKTAGPTARRRSPRRRA